MPFTSSIPARRARPDARHRVAITVGIATVVVCAVAVGLLQTRRTAEARELRATEARQELGEDLTELRKALLTPAQTASDATAAGRTLIGEAVLGWESDRDDAAVLQDLQQRTGQLRDAADDLTEAAGGVPARPPAAVALDTIQPIVEQFESLEEQATNVATQLREAADATDATGRAAHALTAEARRFIRSTDALPAGDDPETVASGLREELERLASYEAAAETAATDPALAPLGRLHLDLTASLREFAEAGVDALAAGELDTYEQLRAQLPAEFETTIAQLSDVAPSVADAAVTTLEHAEARTLGLLHELDQLRRATPPRLASAADG